MRAAHELTQAAWDAYVAGDIDAVTSMLSPDVEIDLTPFEGWLEDGVYYGRAGFRRWITEWLAGWERYESGLHELVEVSPDCVFTISWQRGFGAGSHVPVEMELAEIATIRDGLIARLELWSDKDAAREEALTRAARAPGSSG